MTYRSRWVLYFQPCPSPALLPSLFLAGIPSQQPRSPVASLPWISNHINTYFGSQLPNISASQLDSSKFIMGTYLIKMPKKKNVCLVCPMFILIYLSMWWSTERTYCCAFFLNCMARVLFGFGICQLIFPKVIISWSSYSDVTNRGWWGERMITWAQYS